MAPLLDSAFVAELEVLRRRLAIRARSGMPGDRVARRRGGAAEFEEHRPYGPGDDLRRLDWAAYARSGQPVIKVFRSEEDAVARIVVDTSASMRFGTPPKLDTARRIGAAIGYLALTEGDRAQLLEAAEGQLRGHPPQRGRGRLASLLRPLDALMPQGATDLASSLDQLVHRRRRPGLLLILSDFFDPGPVLTALDRAAAAGHDTVLVQVLARDELTPDVEGDWRLEDAETGATLDLTLDREAVAAYRQRLDGLFATLRGWCTRRDATYVRVATDDAVEAAVSRIVARSRD